MPTRRATATATISAFGRESDAIVTGVDPLVTLAALVTAVPTAVATDVAALDATDASCAQSNVSFCGAAFAKHLDPDEASGIPTSVTTSPTIRETTANVPEHNRTAKQTTHIKGESCDKKEPDKPGNTITFSNPHPPPPPSRMPIQTQLTQHHPTVLVFSKKSNAIFH